MVPPLGPRSPDLTCCLRCFIRKEEFYLKFMYRCKSSILKKAECIRTDAFELCCWRRLLIVPWSSRRSNQPILKEISPEYSLEGWCWSWSSNTLVTWCEEPTHWKIPWWKDWGQEEKGASEGEMVGWQHWLNGHEFEPTPGDTEGQGSLVCCSSWGHKRSNTT